MTERARAVRFLAILMLATALLWLPATARAADGDEPAPLERDEQPATSTTLREAIAATTAQYYGRAWRFGIRGGYYFDTEEPFAGLEFWVPLSGPVVFYPSGDFIFTGEDLLFLQFNVDLALDWQLPQSSAFVFGGGGLAVQHLNPDGPAEGFTDTGGNVLVGLGFGGRTTVPYVQAKWTFIRGGSEFVLMGGLQF